MSNTPIEKQKPLDEYKWKNRLVLLLSDNPTLFEEQKALFGEEKEALKERKILFIEVEKDKYRITGQDWVFSQEVYNTYSKGANEFEIVLIGLDGGEKFRSESLIQPKKLYSIIDVMPMRRAEIERKHNE